MSIRQMVEPLLALAIFGVIVFLILQLKMNQVVRYAIIALAVIFAILYFIRVVLPVMGVS